MDRWWFLTWRTYGTWLPGEGGFVGYYRVPVGSRRIDNVVGELATEAQAALATYARQQLVAEPVFLTRSQADLVLAQLHETAAYREWALDAVAILPGHVHLVLGVAGDPTPTSLLRDFKSYCSRALNKTQPEARRVKWWAERGSTRFLKDQEHRIRAIRYASEQETPLLIWLSDEARALIEPLT
jgi:REP element-mobilizing transposase RayT